MTGCAGWSRSGATVACNRPATATVVAGTPGGPGDYRARATCAEHLEAARRWATAAGPVTVTRAGEVGPVQGDLFDTG